MVIAIINAGVVENTVLLEDLALFDAMYPDRTYVDISDGRPCSVGDSWNGVDFTSPLYTPPFNTINNNRDRLWEATLAYEQRDISKLMATLVAVGVQTSKPKCLAVLAWQKLLWQTYWGRRAAMTTNESEGTFKFRKAVGNCPHNINEIINEVGL